MNEQILKTILELKAENNWQQIVHRFDARIHPEQTDLDQLELLKEVGFAHSQLGNYPRALELYQRWCQLQPGKAQPYYCIGFLFSQQQQYREAIDWYDRALQRFPQYLVCLYRKGVALLKLQKHKLADEVCEQALEIYQNNQDEDFLKRNRKTFIRTLFASGKACYHIRDYQRAVSRFDRVLQEDPRNYILPVFKFYNLGKCYIELKDAERARKNLQRALALDQRKDFIWERLGRFYHKLEENHSEALRCFNRALSCRRVAYILVSRALLFRDQGEIAKAIADLHEALKKDKKGKHKIFLELGKIALHQKKLNEAEAYFNRAIDFKLKIYEVDYAEAHYYLSQVYALQSEEQKAREELNHATEINPSLAWHTRILTDASVQFHDLAYLPEEEE